MPPIDLPFRTLFAELSQRSLDDAFIADFPPEGRFVTVPVKGRAYWYFDLTEDGKATRRYVGPQADPQITARVNDFKALKSDFKARRKLVSTLVREAGLPALDRMTGDVVKAIAEAGFFRLRGVLVGTVAFQCYSGHLGVRLPSASLQTGDTDFAQFHSISAAVDDAMPPILDVLRSVDPTFREIPHVSDGRASARFTTADRYLVEFLTPNRSSADHDGKPAAMPALGGASAEPLRFLDFLIHEPVRTVLLHGSGVSITVPAPERYAIHKLIVATRRRVEGTEKREKDLRQAALLIEALSLVRRQSDLAEAYEEAWSRGPAWREAITRGLASLDDAPRAMVHGVLAEGLRTLRLDPAEFGIQSGSEAPK